MTKIELVQEAWRAWAKDKPFQSEDTAKGFMEGFNFCLNGKIKVEGGDKGELISANFSLQDQLTEAKKIIKDLLGSENTSCEEEMYFEIRHKAEDFIKED